MHERYAYGALIFLLLLIPERRIQWLCLAFGVVFTLNLWSAAPPAPIFRVWLPYPGIHSMIGAVGDDRDDRARHHLDDRSIERGAGRPGPSGRGRRRSVVGIVRP